MIQTNKLAILIKHNFYFQGPLSDHPGKVIDVSKLPSDPIKNVRLLKLIRLAKGGRNEIKNRLCICGGCQLICREDGSEILSQNEHIKTLNESESGIGTDLRQIDPRSDDCDQNTMINDNSSLLMTYGEELADREGKIRR